MANKVKQVFISHAHLTQGPDPMTNNLPLELSSFAQLLDAHLCRTTPAGPGCLQLLPGPHDGRGRQGTLDRDAPRPSYSHTPTHRQAGDPTGGSVVNCR
jgi:hypothetical protein